MFNSTVFFLVVNASHVLISPHNSQSKDTLYVDEDNFEENYSTEDSSNTTNYVDNGGFMKYTGKTLDCECGVFQRRKQKIDENDVQLGDFPWLVGFVARDDNNDTSRIAEPFCYGSLINSRYIITASSCWTKAKSYTADAVFFNHGITGARRHQLSEILMHPKYEKRNYSNNLALVRLKESIRIDAANVKENISPICLPENTNVKSKRVSRKVIIPQRQEFRTLFYGQLSYYFGILEPRIVRKGEGNCSADLFTERLQSKTLCAHEPGTYCYTDPGMPLMVLHLFNGKHILLGVASKGYGCKGYTAARSADVASDISSYTPWILENVSDGSFCKM